MKRLANRQQGGYVLLLVIATLAVVALVAMRFAERADQLRKGVLGFMEYAQASTAATDAQAETLYWMATRPLQPTGRGDSTASLVQDGREYRVSNGALVAVQDARGLLSLNLGDRAALLNLLVGDGLAVGTARAWLDVLDDYIDTDSLKHLNGAERPEYQALGLGGPRNDWLVSVDELELMPLWRDDPSRLARLKRMLSVTRSNQFNPGTAPLDVLKARLPGASPAQLELLLGLRRDQLLRNGQSASAATGLALVNDDFIFYPDQSSRITVWAPGLPRALEYNARLTPAQSAGPWIILEQHSSPRPKPSNDINAAPAFPLSLDAGGPPSSTRPSAPREF